MRILTLFSAMALGLAAQQLPPAPEAARSLTGTATAGWLNSTSQDTFQEHRSNPFTSLRLDFQSYLLAPDFLTFKVQPRFSAGFQDSFTGISEGTGVAFETIFLPRRPFPFRFHYSRFERSSLAAGLVSSYTRFISKNHDSNIGFQWQYVVPRQPSFQISFDKISSATTPEEVLTQGFETRSRTLSITGRDERFGWQLNGGVNFLNLDTQYLLGASRESVVVANQGDIRNMNFTAQRALPLDFNFFFSANRSVNKNVFDRGRFDQTFDSMSAKLEYRPIGRFQAWTQARVTDSGLETLPSSAPGAVVAPLAAVKISNRMVDSEARYQVIPSLSVFVRNEYTRVAAPLEGQVQQSGNFVNSGGGAQFSRTQKGVMLNGSYTLFTTLNRFQAIAPGHSVGHTADASVAVGDAARLARVSAGFSLTRSQEVVRSLLPYTGGSESARLIVARTLLHRWTVEVQGALNQMRYVRQELTSDFRSRDYGISVTNPRYFASYSRSTGSGDSLQRLLGLSSTDPAGVVAPLLFFAGSANKTTSVNAAWHISHSAGLRALWRDQEQSIGSLMASRFEEREATFSWQFRKVRLEAGYMVYRYDFGTPVLRKNIIFRIIRDFQVF